jgi:hypothetical protein
LEIAGTEGNVIIAGDRHEILGKNKWRYRDEKNNPYQTQHDELFASIRNNKPMNDGEFMTNSTMMAILGRMVAYSGQTITWDEAFNSNQQLGPEFNQYSWELEYPGPGVAIPGITKVL